MKQNLLLLMAIVFIFSRCNTSPSKTSTEQAITEPDSVEIIQKYYKGSTQLVEYEIPVLRGTAMKHGDQIRYYRHGSMYSSIPYDHGLKEGIAYTYYPAAEGVKPMVWKAQLYARNMLNGISKRYHENGTLQSEYEYQNGNPGIGLKEFSKSGKLIKQPTLILSSNRTATGYYVRAHMSNNTEKVDYFVGNLIDGKFLPDGLKGLQVKKGLGEIIIDASKQKVTITAVFTTRYRNKCFVSKTINLQ